jgi:hypothetical protein
VSNPLSDRAFGRMKIVATKLGGALKTILVSLVGYTTDTSGTSETAKDVPLHGALGVVVRPRPPDATGGPDVVVGRTDDDVVVLSALDRRLSAARQNLAEGSVNLVGYGQAFVGIDDANAGHGSVVTIYVPYAFTGPNNAPTKAHVFTLDTTTGNESVSLVHSSGAALMFTPDGNVVVKNPAGDAFLQVGPNGVTFNGQIKARTSAVVGDTGSAQEVVLGTGYLAFAAQVVAAIAAAKTALGSAGSAIVVPTIPPNPTSSSLRASP